MLYTHACFVIFCSLEGATAVGSFVFFVFWPLKAIGAFFEKLVPAWTKQMFTLNG